MLSEVGRRHAVHVARRTVVACVLHADEI